MSLKHGAGENRNRKPELEVEAEPELEAEVAQALQHFRASVNAWSEAALGRPRAVATGSRSVAASWRLAAGWALGCVLALGSLSGAIYEHQHRQQLAHIAAQKAAAQKTVQQPVVVEQASTPAVQPAAQRKTAEVVPATENAGSQDETLLATVDTDISQQVPAAMEPLAQLMDSNATQ